MLRKKLLERYENLKDDNKELKTSIDLSRRNNKYFIEKINNLNNNVTKNQVKILDMLNKFNDDMQNNMNNLYEKVMNKNKCLLC